MCAEVADGLGAGHLRAVQGLEYGLARSTLPRNIAMPLDTVARMSVNTLVPLRE
jgi:hypothetical protein